MVLVDGGRKGLELVRREYPDVVVLDLKMPEMEGLYSVQLGDVELRTIKLRGSSGNLTSSPTESRMSRILYGFTSSNPQAKRLYIVGPNSRSKKLQAY